MEPNILKSELHAELDRLKIAIAVLDEKSPSTSDKLKQLKSLKEFVLSELKK